MAKKKNPWPRRIGIAASYIGVLGLAVATVWLFLGSTAFGYQKLRAQGISVITEADLQKAVAVPKGTPLARVDL
ncbi:MAG: hypothetical protein LBR21_02120, partial [Propionibacteriaceae bacterium]|nr:hypothetical protein [Propionibacteriaceae bacterium]